MNRNQFGQPVGDTLSNWSPRAVPSDVTLLGRFCRLEPLNDSHADDLFAAYSDERDWTYMSIGPFADVTAYRAYVASRGDDPKHFAVIVDGKAVGTTALMRIDAEHGVIEVGCVTFSPLMKQTRASTEAHFLFMTYVFDTLKYRRLEWKCDALNEPSRRAALRLGFSFEGIFRNATIYKGRTRDTAWFSMIDSEWPDRKRAFTEWLADDNFDSEGRQKKSLTTSTR